MKTGELHWVCGLVVPLLLARGIHTGRLVGFGGPTLYGFGGILAPLSNTEPLACLRFSLYGLRVDHLALMVGVRSRSLRFQTTVRVALLEPYK